MTEETPNLEIKNSSEIKKWTSEKLQELAKKIGENPDAPYQFTVDFSQNKILDAKVGAADILPPHVDRIRVIRGGVEREGVRGVVNGREGYYSKSGAYVAIHEGDTMIAYPHLKEMMASPAKAESVPSPKQPEKLNVAERDVFERYGGEFVFTPIKCYLNFPQSNITFNRPPRIIVHFHGWDCGIGGVNGESQTDSILRQVEEMRAKGDPVILVMPQSANASDPKGQRWENFSNPSVFTGLIQAVEQKSKIPVDPSITISSFSGGFLAAGQVLDGLKTSKKKSNRDYYNRIGRLALLDSSYGYQDTFADFAKSGKPVASIYTAHLEAKNKQLQQKMKGQAGVIIKLADSPRHLKAIDQFSELV